MFKYSTAFKQSVAEFNLGGDESYASTGAAHGIDHGTVRKSIAGNKMHGHAGLSPKFSHYTADFKPSELRRMWEDERSCRQTSALFNIRNASCLADWEKRYESGGIAALVPRRRGRPES